MCNAPGKKYIIRRNTSCSSENVLHVAYCIKCIKECTVSTISWKPHLSNYKIHVKKKNLTCRTVRNFTENWNDNECNNLRFTIDDCMNDLDGLPADKMRYMSWWDRKYFHPKGKNVDKNISHATSWFKQVTMIWIKKRYENEKLNR